MNLTLTPQEHADLADAVNDRIETLEQLIADGVDPSMHSDWRKELHRLLGIQARLSEG